MSICIHSGQNLEVTLSRGRVLGFDTSSSVELSCVEGSVWVTAPESEDCVLLAGDSATLGATGRVVVQALSSARFRVAEKNHPSARAAA